MSVARSVLKNIHNPTEIGIKNFFSASVTIGVVLELYRFMKKCSYSCKEFCGYKTIGGINDNETGLHEVDEKVFLKKVTLLASKNLLKCKFSQYKILLEINSIL